MIYLVLYKTVNQLFIRGNSLSVAFVNNEIVPLIFREVLNGLYQVNVNQFKVGYP